MFQRVDAYPGDPILTLNETFVADPRADKINLGIGVFLDDSGAMPAMRAVLQAEAQLSASLGPRPYLPMEGSAGLRRAALELTFGADSTAVAGNNVALVQTVGGSGALKVGADFLARYFPQAQVWVSDPTWDNHYSIFGGAGLEVRSYRYYDAATGQVDFAGMLRELGQLPAGDIVVLHACCHNPTGADLDKEQWQALAAVMKARRLLPFFDMAYQGFGVSLDDDAFAVRYFAAAAIPLLVATSFSKNFSLYGERCGTLGVLCDDAEQAANVLGQLKSAIRRNYSSPPTHGARIIARVLETPALRRDWIDELAAMQARVKAMRRALHAALIARRPDDDFAYLLTQTGMFSYTGLTAAQVARMRDEHGVYLLESGRICLAALTMATVGPAAAAIAQAGRR